MNRTEHLLAVLAEECAEVAQRCSKAQRFGLKQTQVDHKFDNAHRIHVEIQDLYAAIDMVREEIGIGSGFGERDEAAIAAKKLKVERYMDRARDLDALDREHVTSTGDLKCDRT